MAATRVYSTAAYFVAAIVAILLGLMPEVRRDRQRDAAGGVLGGITLVLYGMIGLLGAKIWIENGVDFGHRSTWSPLSAGHHRWHRRRVAADHRRLHPVAASPSARSS